MVLRVGAKEQCFGATLSAANVGVLRPPANLPDEVLGPGSNDDEERQKTWGDGAADSRISRAESRWASKAQSFRMVLRVGVKEQCFGTILFAASAMVAVHNMGAVRNRIRRYANKAEGRYAQSEKR